MPRTQGPLTAAQRKSQLAALVKMLSTGDSETIRQAVELAISIGDRPLITALTEGLSFSKTGQSELAETALLLRVRRAWPRETSLYSGHGYWWALWRLGAEAELFGGVERLDFDATGRVDLSEIRSAVDLRVLVVQNGTELVDVSALAELPNLERLHLYVNSAAPLEPLSRCARLSFLDLHGTPPAHPFVEATHRAWTKEDREAGVPILRQLKERRAYLDLALLAPLPKLQSLSVIGLPVGGLEHLHRFPSLMSLEAVFVPNG
ncbi:MAG: hypothetical protein RL653_1012 [Pseudomonadota bacterium]|jgi:hypothetical protein